MSLKHNRTSLETHLKDFIVNLHRTPQTHQSLEDMSFRDDDKNLKKNQKNHSLVIYRDV